MTANSPYLYLPLGQLQRFADLAAPFTCEVAIEVELLLQLQRLMPRVRLPRSLLLAILCA